MKSEKIRINVNDIIGKCLGKLEVVSYAGRKHEKTKGGPKMRHFYVVKCDCGRVKVIRRGQLTSEIVHSCGYCGYGRKGKGSGYKNEK